MLALGNETLMNPAGQQGDAVPADLVAEVLTGDAEGTGAGWLQDIQVQVIPLFCVGQGIGDGHSTTASTPVLFAVVRGVKESIETLGATVVASASKPHTLLAAPEDPDEAPAGRHDCSPSPHCPPRPGTPDQVPWKEHRRNALLRQQVLGAIRCPVTQKGLQAPDAAMARSDQGGVCCCLRALQGRHHLPPVGGGVR